MPASLLLIDQDVAYFRNAQAASPFKVGDFPYAAVTRPVDPNCPRL